MKKNYLLSVFIILLSLSCFSQTTEFKGTVELGPDSQVYKVVTATDCTHTYNPPAGSATTTVTYETALKNGKTDIKVESISNPMSSINLTVTKTLEIPMFPDSQGTANLYVDDTDKSKVYVNYYLNTNVKLKKGTEIREFYPTWDCDTIVTMHGKPKRKLKEDEEFYLWLVIPDSDAENSTWFKHSDRIEVYDSSGNLEYYLVNRYDRNAKYILKLENRESIRYNSSDIDFGALTIPFKYRFGFNKDGIKIPEDVSANFNVGIYAGIKISNYKLINKAGTFTNSSPFSLRVGPFLNLAAVALDSVNTTAGIRPYATTEKLNIAVLSTGAGLMFDFKGLQLGAYVGWDFGMGAEAKNWNYHKRFWLGFGLGYKITDLFAKKD